MNPHETTVKLAMFATFGLGNENPNHDPSNGEFSSGGGSAGVDSKEVREFAAGTKVAEPSGKPIVLYHGSAADFDKFDMKFSGGKTDIKGFYFSGNKQLSGAFSAGGANAQIYHAVLNIKKPATFADVTRLAKAGVKVPQLHAALQKEGFDGIYDKGKNVAIAFKPDQIKIIKKEKA